MNRSLLSSLALLLAACGASQDADTTTTPVAETEPAATEPMPQPEATPPEQPADPAAAEPAAPTAEAPAAPKLTDGEIAAFLAAANKAEIDASTLVKSKAKNPEVKKFAAQMIKDHGAADKKAKAVFGKAGVTPQDGEASRAVTSSASEAIEKLKGLNGAELDRAYIDSQVAMHQQVLDAIDQTLMPNVANADLKAFMTEVRPKIQGHLDHAKQLQTKLAAP
jgi:putative membrane protein